jgi:hypothetical protein
MSQMMIDDVNLPRVNPSQHGFRFAGAPIPVVAPVGPDDVIHDDEINLVCGSDAQFVHAGFDGQVGKLARILFTVRPLFGQVGEAHAVAIFPNHGRAGIVPGVFM